MDSDIKITNVDENGNDIGESESIDWSKWIRERTEELLDDDGNVIELISHCRKYTTEETQRKLLDDLATTEAEDVQAALCELAEQQAAYENDVNAALCELYNLIAGGETNG